MISEQKYVVLSLELHMFFWCIIKEHVLFLEASCTPPNAEFARLADEYKQQFENVLHNTIYFGNSVISPNVVSSGEIVTNYTLGSEQKTENFTAIQINQELTRMESNIYGSQNPSITPILTQRVKNLNMATMPLLNGLIDFKSRILNDVLSCNMFTGNYPLLIEHILREANIYISHLVALENNQNPDENMQDTELFWDQIMMEHALFIRGLLDPTEEALFQTSNNFANEYKDLLQQAQAATDMTISSVTQTTLQATIKYRDFKEAGTKGIAECKIRSIILPLLADHVLRESNHYIRLLRQFG